MTPTQAREFAASLITLADRVEAEGREELTEADLAEFAAADDAARAVLAAAIKVAGG